MMNSISIIEVSGKEAVSFLQGYLTGDLEQIKLESAIPMALTEIKGRVIANGWVFGSGERVSMIVHTSVVDLVREHLSRYIVFARCELEDANQDNLDLSEIPSDFPVALAPFGWGLTQSDETKTELDRLTVGAMYPVVRSVTSGMFLPQMLNLTQHGAVSFTKGCYLGQEIIARAEHRGQVKRQLFKSEVDSPVTVGETYNCPNYGSSVVVAVYDSEILAVGRVASSS